MTSTHILIVDDDLRLRQLLGQYLQHEGFVVSSAKDAFDAADFLKFVQPNALIVDMMMPRKNGDEFIKDLRKQGYFLPIIMLTAKGDTESRINGLEAGADDYLPKPFEPKELLLRLHNLIKRTATTQNLVSFGPYTYDTFKNLLMEKNKVITLTTAEHTLLKLLTQHQNSAVSREELAEALELENIRTIDVQITRLRKKLETDTNTHFIQTIRGKGYRLITA